MIRGRNRIIEKVKNLRQNFSKAVTAWTRSRSGKIVYEFFDKLVTICEGSADTKPLQFGVQYGDYATNGGYDDSDCDNEEFMENGNSPVDRNERSAESSSSVNLASNFEKVTEVPNANKEKVYDNMKSVDVDSQFQLHEESNSKRKHEIISKVPKLIDQKRKHLEKNLSAVQHDKLLFEEAKEASFRRELSDSLKQSSNAYVKSSNLKLKCVFSKKSSQCSSQCSSEYLSECFFLTTRQLCKLCRMA